MQVKVGRPLKELLTLAYRANQPLLLRGPHGVGKSASAVSVAEDLGIDIVVFDLSLMEPSDLAGIPQIENNKTVFCPPKSLPTSGKGFFMVEEMNRAPTYMRAPMLNLLTARTLNDYKLPDGWVPIGAVNPTVGYCDVNELDKALVARFSVLDVVADHEEWLIWAVKNEVHPKVIEFVKLTSEIFSPQSESSNPRSWTYVSNVLKAFEKEGGRVETLLPMVAGLLDDTWAASFIRFYKNEADVPLTAADITADFSVNEGIVATWKKGKKMDLFETSWRNLKNFLQKQKNYDDLGEGELKNIAGFLEMVPKDMGEVAKEWLDEMGYDLCHR